MKEIVVDAILKNQEKVTKFINDIIQEYEYSDKTKAQINIAIDELFGNIVKYAYKDRAWQVKVQAEVIGEPHTLRMRFTDIGIQYNPLSVEEPDITSPATERKIGGLGILVAKKLVDGLKYEYEDGKNILEVKKILK